MAPPNSASNPSSDHYETLQISRQASPDEIKQAFRRLARQHHPDLNPNNAEASEIFRRLRAAYDTLSDPIQRRYYDEAQGFVPRSGNPVSATGGAESVAPESAHHFYLQGIDQEAARNYGAALEFYTQAIERQPDFSAAILHRAKVLYALAQDRKVLEDCTRLLELKTHQSSAYFYQGLARNRLGYTQSAVTAFSQTIEQESDHGQAFYQRALAQLELGEREDAIADFQRAMECFQAQGDGQQYHRTADRLRDLGVRFSPASNIGASSTGSNRNRPQPPQAPPAGVPEPSPRHRSVSQSVSWLIPAALGRLPSILFNPSANLLPLYGRLGPGRAGFTGLIWLGLSYGLGVLAAILRWSADRQQVVWPIAIVVTIAIASFVAGIGLLRLIKGYWDGMAKVLFVAGAALLPLGLLCLVMAPRASAFLPWQWSLMAIALSMAILILHSGLIQICDLPEASATLAVPALLLVSGWLAYWAFQILIPPPLELLDAPTLIRNSAVESL